MPAGVPAMTQPAASGPVASAVSLIAIAAGVVGLALLVLSIGAVVAMISMSATPDQPVASAPAARHADAATAKPAHTDAPSGQGARYD